jgi:hypothetical protein
MYFIQDSYRYSVRREQVGKTTSLFYYLRHLPIWMSIHFI